RCVLLSFLLLFRPRPRSTLFPYTTLFRSELWRYTVTMAATFLTGGEVASASAALAQVNATSKAASVSDIFFALRESFRLGMFHRSEEHTSELQSRSDLVCRLLLEKKNDKV